MKNTVLILLVSFIFNNHKINNFNSDYFYDFLLCEYYSLKNLVHEKNNCYLSLEEKISFHSNIIVFSIAESYLEKGHFRKALNYYLKAYNYNKHDIDLILLIYNLNIIIGETEVAQNFLIDSYYLNKNNNLLLEQLFAHFLNNSLLIETIEILADLYDIEKIAYSEIINKCKLINDNFSNHKLIISILDHHFNKYKNLNFIDLKFIFYYINDDFNNIKSTFQNLETLNKTNPDNTLLFCKKLLNQNEFKKIFDLLLSYFNNRQLQIEGMQLLLEASFELNDLDFYLEVSQVVYEDYDSLPISHEILINALMKKEQYLDALKFISIAKSQFPKYFNFSILEAKIEIINGNLNNAINIYKYLLKNDSSLIDVKHDLAILYNKIEEYQLCDDIFFELLNIDADNLIFITEFSSIIANRKFSTDEEMNYALKLVDYGLDIYADNSILLDIYGWLNYKLGNYDLALFYVRKSLSISHNEEVLDHLVKILKNDINKNKNNKVEF